MSGSEGNSPQPGGGAGSPRPAQTELVGSSYAFPFRTDFPLQDWARNCFRAPVLWQALANAVKFHCGSESACSGIVLAEEPLIGLASIHALGLDVHVPVRNTPEDLKIPSEAGLEDALKRDDTVTIWRRAASHYAGTTKILLMRAWGSALNHDMIIRDITEMQAQPPHVICLLQRTDSLEADCIIADTTARTVDIIAKVIEDLQLLGNWKILQDYEHNVKALVTELTQYGTTPTRILDNLNSEGHGEFRRLLSDYQTRKSGGSKLFKNLIQTDTETAPRHAASLFVASHFPALRPDEFLQLADLLVPHTPAIISGRGKDQNPLQVTDQVLEECHISFESSGPAGSRAAVISFPSNETVRSSGTAASAVASSFENNAPLLKERYLRTLALHLTLGHHSEAVARPYQQLEIDALRSSTKGQAKERLRRIVFGYPAFAGAPKDYVSEHRRNLEATMMRAIRNTPDFLNKLFKECDSALGDGPLSRADAVEALCTAQPTDSDDTWLGVFDETAARLFWYLFASNAEGVTLRAYPALFGQGDMMVADRITRRHALLAVLQPMLDTPGTADYGDELAAPLRNARALSALMAQTVAGFWDIPSADPYGFAEDFTGEVACHYLLRIVRDRRWDEVQPWPPADDPAVFEPAAPLFSRRFQTWLMPRQRYAQRLIEYYSMDNAGDKTGQLRLAETLRASSADELLAAEGRRTWLFAIAAIDGLTGCAKLGWEREAMALTMFLRDRLGLPDDQEAAKRSEFSYTWFWEWLCSPETAAHYWVGDVQAVADQFEHILQPLWRVIPVLLLMAATQSFGGEKHTFQISEATRRYLTDTSSDTTRAPLLDILDSIRTALELQQHFLKSVSRQKFPPRKRAQWREAFHSRQTALEAFRQTLYPLQHDLHAAMDQPAEK